MNETVKEVKVRGYNKTHTFSIERSSVAGYTFYRFLKNGNVVLNCTPDQFDKFQHLFTEEDRP